MKFVLKATLLIATLSPVLLQVPLFGVPLYISFIPPVSVVLTIFQQKFANNKLLLSWKRRLKNNVAEHIHQEEEVELNLDPAEYKNLILILENVLKMKKVESYERYRSIYLSKEVEIVLDEFPFGLALEIESLTKSEDSIKKWLNKLKLDINRSYRYSWDDKYAELCQQQKKTIYNNVTFELDMPKVEEKFDGKL